MDKLEYIEPEERTFKTRLEYINYIFSHVWTPDEIMRASIEHRLNLSYEKYLEDLDNSIKKLLDRRNPVPVIKTANKE